MEFVAVIEVWPGKRWLFLRVPNPPPATHPWGRIPVHAEVDGVRWETSTWGQKAGGAILLLPKSAFGPDRAGAEVAVALYPRVLTDEPSPRRRARRR